MATVLPPVETFRWHLWLSLTVLGFTGGLFAGMSESPVGSTIVGAVFGLLGAGGLLGLVFQTFQAKAGVDKKDDEKPTPKADPELLRAGAIGVITLCVASVMGVWTGIELREGRLFPPVKSGPSPTLVPVTDYAKELTATQQLKLVLLQAQLSELGVPVDQNNAFVRSFGAAADMERIGFSDELISEIHLAAQDIKRALVPAREALGKMESADSGGDDDKDEWRIKTIEEVRYGDVEEAFQYLDRIIPVTAELETKLRAAATPDIDIVLDMIARFQVAEVEQIMGKRARPLIGPPYQGRNKGRGIQP